jgi:hypothetical protein
MLKVVLGTTVFLSSFLLFLVQPIVAKQLLPRFGGSAGVWVVCMVFFQTVLLLGYFYSHGLITRLAAKPQRNVHIALVILSLLTLPIIVGPQWKASGGSSPTLAVLAALVFTVGMPYFILSTTSPLIQAWWARGIPGSNPYRLFALSNVAAIAGLVAYPFAIEPFLSVKFQVLTWTVLFGTYCVLALLSAIIVQRVAPVLDPGSPASDESGASQIAPAKLRWLVWIGLPALASVALLAITNHLTQNLSSGPLLWIVPLALYLVTFVLCFDGKGWYRRSLILPLIGITIIAWIWTQADSDLHYLLPWQLALHLTALFALCMYCHGELAALKPVPSQLTGYYLAISIGGALGAMLVGIVAPVVFPAFLELQVTFCAIALLILLREWKSSGWPIRAVVASIAVATAGASVWAYQQYTENTLHASRNFYGTLRVKELGPPALPDRRRSLLHGTILHGDQFVDPPYNKSPTSYYRSTSGIGRLIAERRQEFKSPMKIGVVGLGSGTLAVYGRPNDHIHFYEIDKDVIDIASQYFSYLKDSYAKVQVTIGDARLVLEGEPNQNFDILVVDAFSGDAIPVHLITREAMVSYHRHLKGNGVIAFHISNRFLNLKPVLANLAGQIGSKAYWLHEAKKDGSFVSDWVLISGTGDPFGRKQTTRDGADKTISGTVIHPDPASRVWTDDYHDLLSALK